MVQWLACIFLKTIQISGLVMNKIGWQIQVTGSETMCGGAVTLRSKKIYLDRNDANNAIAGCIAWAVQHNLIYPHYERNESAEPKGTLVEVEIVA
jgi:hypothetical protein